jgi:hypothetical protein
MEREVAPNHKPSKLQPFPFQIRPLRRFDPFHADLE